MKIPTLAVAGIILVALILVIISIKFLPRKLKHSYFLIRWKKLQAYCRNKDTWPKALEEADNLLGRALKKRKLKGKSMGEKMVSAQRIFTENDAVWYAHNLYKKVRDGKAKKIRESEIKDALIGYRQALRDLGALPNNESK